MSQTLCWPSPLDPRDPFEEDSLPAGGNREIALFVEAWRALDLGGGGHAELEARARALGLTQTPLPETSPLPAPDAAPCLDDVVRIACDLEPDIASWAPDVVLGPYALDATRHDHAMAVAWASLHTLSSDPTTSPIGRWLRSSKAAPRSERLALSALLRAPPAPYRVLSLEGQTATLAPMLDLGAAEPTGPVHIAAVAQPAGPLSVGGGLLARVLPVGAQRRWFAALGFAVRVPDPPSGWLSRATWLVACQTKAAPCTIPDVLRLRGIHLVRRMLEREWT